MPAPPDDPDAHETVADLIDDAPVCMLTTRRADGTMMSRPMRWLTRDGFDGDLWFFTYGSSRKVEDVGQDAHVNVAFFSDDHAVAVSVRGTAAVVRDPATLDELWEPKLNAWFPEGRETEDLVLLRVEGHGAEYWDGSQNPVEVAVGLVKGLVTDGTAGTADNEKLTLDA